MWKILCLGVLLVGFVAAGKVPAAPGKLIGPITEDPANEWPLFGSYFTNKYAKIAREIVHNTSKLFIFSFSLKFSFINR